MIFAKLRQIQAQIKIAYLRRKYLSRPLPLFIRLSFLMIAGAACIFAPDARMALAETDPRWANWAQLDAFAYMGAVLILLNAASTLMKSQDRDHVSLELQEKAEAEIKRLTIEAERSALDSVAKSAKSSTRPRSRL